MTASRFLDVTNPYRITAADSIDDTLSLYLHTPNKIATFESGGSTYAAVASFENHGVQILDVTNPSAITYPGSITDRGNTTDALELAGAVGIATFESGGSTYAAVAAYSDNGVQILNITDPSAITAAGSITDGGSLELRGVSDIAIFKSGGSTYAAVVAFLDDGVQILNITDPYNINATDNITDGGGIMLDGADEITIFESDGHTYAAVVVSNDDAIHILDVTDPSAITSAGSIADGITTILDNLNEITIFESGGHTYIAVSSYAGVQIIRVDAAPDTTPPVIALRGTNPATVIVNSTYTERGAVCTDDGYGSTTLTSISDTIDTSTHRIILCDLLLHGRGKH